MRRVIDNKVYLCCKKQGPYWRKQKPFQTVDMEIRYDCVKHFHILCMTCANGIVFGL